MRPAKVAEVHDHWRRMGFNDGGRAIGSCKDAVAANVDLFVSDFQVGMVRLC